MLLDILVIFLNGQVSGDSQNNTHKSAVNSKITTKTDGNFAPVCNIHSNYGCANPDNDVIFNK
jgi:hypothetical protein